MGAISEAWFLLSRHRAVFDLHGFRPWWPLRLLFCVAVVLYFLLYPLFLIIHLVRRGRTSERAFLDRLRFHWNRPLTFPGFEGCGYNLLDYLRRGPSGEFRLGESKLAWRRVFLAGAVRTPDLFLIIDETTPLAAARHIPATDIVMKRNSSGRGRHVAFYRFDPQTGLFEGRLTAEDVVRVAQSWRSRVLADNSCLVTRAVRVSPRMPYFQHRQHLRCITVKTRAEPVLFRAMLHVQFGNGRFCSNHSQGARVFDVTGGALDGVPLVHFDEAVAECLALHRGLDIASIGWDILLSDEGPCFLEGNINHSVFYSEYTGFDSVLHDYYRLTEFVK